ncbi:MAG TPA: hypothetical protein ENJ56_01915, partial [Anaerolineae bacterium]|nr:hypothetical protein [Anaerolineae bacterium]
MGNCWAELCGASAEMSINLPTKKGCTHHHRPASFPLASFPLIIPRMSQLSIMTQLSLGISSHNNHFLFSDHYLNEILKKDPRWKKAVIAAATLLPPLTDLYQHEKSHFANYSEAQLEENWFKPIFKLLGHTYEAQAKIPGLSKGIKYPDYVFFPDEQSRQHAASQQKTHDYAQQALAAGEVKAWDIPLGKKQKGVPNFSNNNPSYQIDYYLRATDLSWGILSNGRLWRLVHKDSSYKLDVYFELDLAAALDNQNIAALAFFVLFFQQASLRPDSSGRIFLADALQASADYALQLENDLRDNAYKALEHLIQGFLTPQANQLSAA